MTTDAERFALWCRYYLETETHDRALPGAWDPRDPECWMPLPAYRLAMLGFASRTLRRLGLAGGDPMRHQANAIGYAGWQRICMEAL
jgi:hypothetical protein